MSTNLYAQANPDAILGIWFNEEKDVESAFLDLLSILEILWTDVEFSKLRKMESTKFVLLFNT